MKIFVLTPTYPSKYSPKGTTPVVHYFAKQWVQLGHDVYVFHIGSVFPKLYYYVGKVFKRQLDSRLGFLVPKIEPKEYDEKIDGVNISHVLLKKYKPHGRFGKSQLQRAVDRISNVICKEGKPDCFVGHWDNPQMDLLYELKNKFCTPTCIVFHNNDYENLSKFYGKDLISFLNHIDLIGFRNLASMQSYEKVFGRPSRSFIASSGVSSNFIEAGNKVNRNFLGIKSFIFIGALIRRKHPVTIIDALIEAYADSSFKITFVGEGNERELLDNYVSQMDDNSDLCLTGRLPREEIASYLEKSDVFVMVSEGEVFGLVYLEAMAMGCITIASKGEGIDGIIEDGKNGFLCEAGNKDALVQIIRKIRKMSSAELSEISERAKQTAMYYSDSNVAYRYVKELENLTTI